MNRAYKIAKAPNQEESELGCGVSNSRQVFIRIGRDFEVLLEPDVAIKWAEGVMQSAHFAIARRAVADAAWKGDEG